MLPVLLFLLCQPHTIFHAPGPMCRVIGDDGAIYFTVCGTSRIRTTDGATFFDSPTPIIEWDVDHGVLAFSTLSGITVVFPDGTQREIPQENGIQKLRIFGGYVYWVSSFESVIRRAPLGGGSVETVADGVAIDARFPYTVFEDRLVFANPQGLFVVPASGGTPSLLVPRGDIDSIAGASADGILITTSTRLIGGRAQLLRVPWLGAPIETLYDVSREGLTSGVTLTALQAGDTIYVAQYETIGCCSLTSRLIVLRDGTAQTRFSAFGPFTLIDADESSVRLAHWQGASQLLIEEICAAASKTRAVSR